MAKDDTSDPSQIHVVPVRRWNGKFPIVLKNQSALQAAYDQINRRRTEGNTTRHRRRARDIHLVRNPGGTSKCGES
jgi:hypothetical protein